MKATAIPPRHRRSWSPAERVWLGSPPGFPSSRCSQTFAEGLPHYCVCRGFSLCWSCLRSCDSAGLFFIVPCTDNFINVDMRTITFDIPPQEVRPAPRPPPAADLKPSKPTSPSFRSTGVDQRLCDGERGRRGLLPGPERHPGRSEHHQRRRRHPTVGSDHPEERAGNQEPRRDPLRPRGDRSQHAGTLLPSVSARHLASPGITW